MSLFNMRETGTNFFTEVLAGITTFVTMSYIIFVNPSILGNIFRDASIADVNSDTVYQMYFSALIVVTCLASA
ncbi:MAG: hypothetical protein IJG34_12160, partial [Synergistaceae bacterium]|nr:hypothetical protein [Synergistaceae bacterium]